MLKIRLNKMLFHAHIGVYQEERKVGQDVEITITLQAQNTDIKTLLADDLNNTINYGPIYRKTKSIVEENQVQLIETLAALILQAIKDEYKEKLDNIVVNIKKQNLPIDGILDSAEVELSYK